MRRIQLFAVPAVIAVLALALAAQSPDLYSSLRWRNIGPIRAGRVSAVTGVIGQPGKFYMGLPDGGVWETDNAGVTWRPIFDSVHEVDSIGSLAVAPSDPNIIYAGTGDLITGLSLNEGNGLYKSTDAGRTWHQSGLLHTHRIAALLVDPKNPDLILAAAQGDYHFKSDSRGVFRSTDGGATWSQTLFRDDVTGARSLASAYDDPTTVFATTYLHYNPNPGIPHPPLNGTALYKSTDEGATWQEISGHGLPTLTGRAAVAVAQGTHSQRLFLVGGFGLYRSDDGGQNWVKSTTDRRITGSDYICGVYVDPHNPDLVYVMQTSMYRSTDGGKTFASFKGAPGGDDNHDLWIDPTNADRILLGSDQGAAVSLDHGATWSPWYNQSTAQVYRIATGFEFPYWVYATMQDSGAVAVASRGGLGEITPFDWYPMPAGEAGSVAPDPLDHNVIYAGGLSSALVKVVRPQWTYSDVSPGGNGKAYRQFTNPPLVFLPQDPHILFFGSQYVSKTSDGGAHWTDISPDLSTHNGQPPVMPAYGRPSPALTSIAPSPAQLGVIWTGSNNGLMYLTRDSGAHWKEVTPPNTPVSGEFNFIAPSHTRAGEAYAELDNRNVGDYLPHILRTRDFGATWTPIVEGLPTDEPEGSFVRVVREDPKVPGLLYCGTENTVYVSFDDGDHWQSLRLNLPTTSIRDLVVKDNDLVIGTYGRGFWILDDMSPLRELARAATVKAVASDSPYLFRPGAAVRVYRDVNADTPFPPEVPHEPNPPVGAILYYHLAAAASSPVTITIRDARGASVRTLSSTPDPALAAFAEQPLTVPDYWKQRPRPLSAGAGSHRANWDLRYDPPPTSAFDLPMTAVFHATPPAPQGPLALPGTYQVTLTVDGMSATQPLNVINDPRHSRESLAGLEAQHALEMKLMSAIRAAHAAAEKAAASADPRLAALAGASGGRGRGSRGAATATPTLNQITAQLSGQLNLLDGPSDAAPTGPQRANFTRTCEELNKALATLHSLDPATNPQPQSCTEAGK